jgi:hypothetical protein
MGDTIYVNTRQKLLLIEAVRARLTAPDVEAADKAELHGVSQALEHSMQYEGGFSKEVPTLEAPPHGR